jgi:hypothetical protein
MPSLMRHRYLDVDPEKRLRQLDVLLLEIFGARNLPDEIAERIAMRQERDLHYMTGIVRGVARVERVDARALTFAVR